MNACGRFVAAAGVFHRVYFMVFPDNTERFSNAEKERLTPAGRQSEKQDADQPSLVGKQLGNYILDVQIGRGGMGVIYKAHHRVLKRPVAIKVLHFKLAEEVWKKRFENEAKLLSMLSNPNIVAVHDFGFDADGFAYLVMDYLQGESLAQALYSGPLDIERFTSVMLQVCNGLIAAHEKGLVHRDIKPSNIFLARDEAGREVVKLLDFGLAKEASGEDQNLTSTGEIVGTPLYMSPEHLRQKKLDARSDLYSLGCVMYECLTGRPPFVGESALDTAILHLESRVPHITATHEDRRTISQLDLIVGRCMAKAPADRYDSVRSLAFDLEQLRNRQTITGIHQIALVRPTPLRLAVVTCVLFVAAVIAIAVATHNAQPTQTHHNGPGRFIKAMLERASQRSMGQDEFVKMHVEVMHVSQSDAQQAFQVLDQDGNGFIDKDELIAELLVCNEHRLDAAAFVRQLAKDDGHLQQAVRAAYTQLKSAANPSQH